VRFPAQIRHRLEPPSGAVEGRANPVRLAVCAGPPPSLVCQSGGTRPGARVRRTRRTCPTVNSPRGNGQSWNLARRLKVSSVKHPRRGRPGRNASRRRGCESDPVEPRAHCEYGAMRLAYGPNTLEIGRRPGGFRWDSVVHALERIMEGPFRTARHAASEGRPWTLMVSVPAGNSPQSRGRA
jgi:hypothetical protein